MVESVYILTQMEILLESNMIGILILSYIFLSLILLVSFVNIYSVDKYEFLYNKQKCIEFKFKVPFIIKYSKEKHIISRKTFILEIIGYVVFFIMAITLIYSLTSDQNISYILLGIMAFVVLAFGVVTGYMYSKIKNYMM